MPQRVAVETWDPEYGSPVSDFSESGTEAQIDASVEIPVAEWRPLTPTPEPPPERVVFVDGVRRMEAHAWIEDAPGARPRPGVLASCAAGAAVADGRVTVGPLEVRRRLFVSGSAEEFRTAAGVYEPRAVVGDGPEARSAALQEELRALEIEIADRIGAEPLLVVDGPLSARVHFPGAVGYIKTHRVNYLADSDGASEVVAALEPGQRTPVFRFRTSWTRNSWYLRLPGPRAHAWSGTVRLESAADRSLEETRALADLTAALLPRFASTPHKDPRAPQNLFPIAGLERELRRRLGDRAYVERALRAAASPPR